MKRNRFKRLVGYIIVGTIYVLSLAVYIACKWSKEEYGVALDQMLYTIVSPLKGANTGVLGLAFQDCMPFVLRGIIVYIFLVILDCLIRVFVHVDITLLSIGKTIHINVISWCRKFVAILGIVTLIGSLLYVEQEYQVMDYIKQRREVTTIYEDYYVSPDDVAINVNGDKRNLILIYMESMETSYASKTEGGNQEVNLIPNLTQLAKDEISFSDKNTLGGFQSVKGTGWTVAALFATMSGIPFSFPIGDNSMNDYETFASGATLLGDILKTEGYNQQFLCGSQAEFGGRKQLFEQHGDFEVFDWFTAREEGCIPEDYNVNWGFEDEVLYEIAKDEIISLSEKEEPFNFTMLTVDTHFPDGYVCGLCSDTYDTIAANVVACADRQIKEFIDWCKEQSFYDNTTIVIIGDHPRMDTVLVEEVPSDERTIYNCFINAEKDTENVQNRIFTSLDIFPTILSAMGFEIEDDRLGLGTDMFSTTPTLVEDFGLNWMQEELWKYSNYYIKEFN